MEYLRQKLDLAGMSISILCAIHCLSLPVILSVGAFSGFSFLANPAIEMTVIGLGLVVAICSILPNYLKLHGQIHPLLFVIFGFALIFLGHLFGHSILGTLIISIGAFSVAFAHYLNIRLNKKA